MARLSPGSAVILQGRDGLSLAAVVGGPFEDGTYDLDSQHRVRPQALTPFPMGEMVEYHSASMNSWIPAQMLRQGRAVGTFDLDCKDGVEVKRIRLPAGHPPPSGPSAPPATSFLNGRNNGPGSGTGLQVGEWCFYKSSSQGWIPAKVVRAINDEAYDLDVKNGAGVQNIYPLRADIVVEYQSASANSWIPAKLLKPGSEQGTFDLDCKSG
ncbi:unnamed protein product, partial [Polarella glacialis]